jgi:hypothetical protein
VKRGASERLVRLKGRLVDPSQFDDIVVLTRNGQSVRLSQVARVEDSQEEERDAAYVSGQRAVVIEIRKVSGGNTVEIADRVNAEVAKLNRTLPRGARLAIVQDNSVWIRDSVEDVQKTLLEVPEYRIAAQKGAGPYVGKSSPTARAGRIWIDMTGGTEGPKKAMEKLADAGVGTIVGMHMGQELRDEADKHNIHVVIAGHMSSDSVGINLFLDELERNGVQTIATSGLIRVHRDESGTVVKEEPGALPRR